MMKKYDVVCIGIVNVNMPVRPVDRRVFDNDLTLVGPIDLMLGGDAMNEAITLTRLGNNVGLAGRIGDDPFGRLLLDMTQQAGVDTGNIKVARGSKTSACIMLINENGDRNFASHRGANSEFCREDIDPFLMRDTKILNFGSLMAMKSLDGTGTEAVLNAAKANGVITSADMMSDAYKLGFNGIKGTLRLLDYFMPSYQEACSLTGETDPGRIADFLLAAGVKNVVLKLGAEGCFVKNCRESFRTEAYKTAAIDTTGAGDNFVAGFLTGLVQDWDLRKCAAFANAAGAITVQKIGPTGAVTSMQQVLQFMDGREQK